MNAQFAASLLNPESSTPAGLLAPAGVSLDARYAVYRNNVTCSLIEALEAGFPVLRDTLGTDYFHALAAEFARSKPPDSPVLPRYGAALPGFIDEFPPLKHLPWLGDLARLELVRRETFDAQDCHAEAARQLVDADPDTLMNLVPQLHPSTRWVASRWPLYRLWTKQSLGDSSPPEQVLVVRPVMQVHDYLLPAGGIPFLAATDGCTCLGDIAARVLQQCPDTDLPVLLALLVETGAIARFSSPTDLPEEPAHD